MSSHSRHAARTQRWPTLAAGRAPLSVRMAPAAERHAVRRPAAARFEILLKLLILAAILAPSSAFAAVIPEDGDLVFHTSLSSQSHAIQKATHSPWSHMGLVVIRGGRPYVFEAISTVRYTPLAEWIARGKPGSFVAKRLKAGLSRAEKAKLIAEAKKFAGKAYDLTFEWSDERIYCSELVWKIFKRALGLTIGDTATLREFDLSDPAVRSKMRERYGSRVPLGEIVIAPAAMFESSALVRIDYKKGA